MSVAGRLPSGWSLCTPRMNALYAIQHGMSGCLSIFSLLRMFVYAPKMPAQVKASASRADVRARRMSTSLSLGRVGRSGGDCPPGGEPRLRFALTGVTVPSPPPALGSQAASRSSAAAAVAAAMASVGGVLPGREASGKHPAAGVRASPKERRDDAGARWAGAEPPRRRPRGPTAPGGEEHGVRPSPVVVTRSMRAKGVKSTV